MQTINHFLKPIGGAQAQPLRSDAALFAPPEAVPIGLAGNLVVHVRPNGTADMDPADLAGLEIETWRFVMAADWDPATPPAFLCTDISHAAGSGIWTIQLTGSRTREMLLAIGRLGVATMGFELAGIAAGDTWASPSYLLQWRGAVVNRRDSGSTPWPAPDDPDTGGVPAHKSNHATGGSDALAPSDIGAAAEQHTHAQADVTGLATALAGKAAASHTHSSIISTDVSTHVMASNDGSIEVTHGGYDGPIADWDDLADACGLTPSDNLTPDDIRNALGLPTTATIQEAIEAALNQSWTRSVAFQNAIAAPFSTTTAYAVGALCTYKGLLYECTTAHAAGAWNLAHFTKKTVAEARPNPNILARADGTTLDTATAVYRATATGGVIPSVVMTGIPNADAYFAFELEIAVPSGATLDDTAVSGWTWLDGGELPSSDYAGKTLYIAARLDCTARTVSAFCYEVR